MKDHKQTQLIFKAYMHIHDEYVFVQISISKRSLVVLATIMCALLTPTPFSQLLDILSRLIH